MAAPPNTRFIREDGQPDIPGGSGGLVSSVFGRISAVIAMLGDYTASLITTTQGTTVQQQLDALSGATCQKNAVDSIGLYACAENDQTISSGFGAKAEGCQTRAGLLPLVFSIAPGGTLVTIVGNWVGMFTNGVPARATPTAPVAGPTLNCVVASVPAFAAGNTTFQIAAPLDGTTTAGLIVESGQTITTGGVQRGIGAHAEGVNTIAQGAESHAEGAVCIAYGPGAHAEGGITTAWAIQAHAEGESTNAYGVDSHAEGGSTIAGGFCAHAEGGAGATPGPQANGNSSHAEGVNSQTGNAIRTFTIVPGGTLVTIAGLNVCAEYTANGQVFLIPKTPFPGAAVQATIDATGPVFAAGNTTFNLTVPIANGVGLQTPLDGPQFANQISGGVCVQGSASGVGAHAEGAGVALGRVSHAEGNACQALGLASHAEGQFCISFGINSHSEGQSSQAIGVNAHAEGNVTLSNANASHTEGTGTRAGFPLRAFTIPAGGTLVTIVGNATAEFLNGAQIAISSTTPNALPPVILNCASVPAFAAGNTTFNLSASIDPYTTGGQINTPGLGTSAHAEGNGTIASGVNAHAEGIGSTASGAQSHAEGSNSIASGTNSHCEGTNGTASNTSAHAEGNQCTASNANAHAEGNICTASGQSSHAEGNGTTAGGTAAHAEGDSTQAQGNRAHAEGISCQARNDNAHAEGNDCFADGVNSHAQGLQSHAYGLNEHAEAGGQFAARGDNQYRRTQLKASTPGAVAGESAVLLTGGAANNFLQNSTAYLVIVRAIATRMGLAAAARQTAGFNFEFVASVTSAGVVTVSAVTTIAATILQGAGFVGATLVPSTGGANDLTLSFTIAGGLTVASRITASVEFVEVLGT